MFIRINPYLCHLLTRYQSTIFPNHKSCVRKKGVPDSKYIYYFVTNPWFRNIAIKSMVGSSGRQRVQLAVLENLVVNLPPLAEQKRIADILGALDDKIELNRRINDNLAS